MDQQVAELSASLSVDVKTTASLTEPEPQLDLSSPMDDVNKSKKKKKKKKNRRKSLEKDELNTKKDEQEEAKEGQEETEGPSIEASAVPSEASISETVVTEKEKHEEETKDNESGPQPLEAPSSLDTIRASGTRAVGSLFSRFKMGRKKSVPSPNEAAMKHENGSPVETAKKQVKEPEEKVVDTKSARVEEGEQSESVSAKKDQDEVVEEQRKEEKDTMQTTMSSAKSRDGVQTQVKESEVVDSLVHLSSTDTVKSDDQQLADADSKINVSSEGVTESIVEVDGTAISVDDDGSTVTAVETLKHETLIALETTGSTDEQDITTEVQDENVSASAKIATDESTEQSQYSADVVMSEPVPLKLDHNLDAAQLADTTQNQVEVEVTNSASLQSDEAAVETFVTETFNAMASSNNDQSEAVAVKPSEVGTVGTAAPDDNAQNETAVGDDVVVNPSVTESVTVVESNEISQSEAVAVEPSGAEMVGTAAPDDNAQNETAVGDDVVVNTSVTESVTVVESNEISQSEAVAVESLVAEMVGTAPSDDNAQNETAVGDDVVVNTSVTESVKVVESNENSQSKAISTDKMELMAVKVTPPTSELPVVVAAPATPERTSPVKSLASRFEGKREQSLDSLKFRTVREFFPEERSIRVGAEKKKYEAQAQQQKLKAKAEDKAKAKYKAGAGFKSPEKEAVSGTSLPELKNSASVVQEPVVTDVNRADPAVFTTPDTAASRKKFSFDGGYAATDSSSKFSDDVQESLTPVKSIASRFEGKREQSLDNLKFRTVREFFPDGGERSIYVGAEKAKYEAIRKQQEEASMTAEHVRPKVTAHLPTPTTVERENSVEAVSVDASVTTSLSSLDDACIEIASATLSSIEAKNGAVVESADDSVEGVAVGDLSADGEAGATVKKSPEASCILPSTSTVNAASITVIKEDKLGISGQAIVDTAVAEPVSVDNGNFEAPVEANEKIKFDQESGKAVSDFNIGLVELGCADSNRRADNDITEDSHANKPASLNIEQNAKSEEVEDIVSEIDSGLEKQSFGEAVVNISAEFDGGVIKEGKVGEQVNVLQAPISQSAAQVAEEKAANSELIELDLGKPVEGVQVDSSVSFSTGEVTITGGESESVGIEQSGNNSEASTESRGQVPESASSAENGPTELDLGEAAVEASKEQMKHETKKNSRPMLTTEQLFMMEDDHTIETVETVVVGERPMTDGEDDFEHLSPTKIRPAHQMFYGSTSSRSTKASIKQASVKASPKLTRKVSAASVGSVKSTFTKSAVSIPGKCASKTAPTSSSMAKKTLKANESHKASLQLKKKRSAPELKGKVSDTGFIKPPPAAPTVPVPMKRSSITASTTSSQARNISDHTDKVRHSLTASTTPVSKRKDTVGRSGHVKPFSPTVPVAPRRASITAPTASSKAKNAAEHFEDIDVAVPSAPVRNKKYTNVKSKVFAGIQSGSMHTTTHKTITKEEFIAAERRKSLGLAGVSSALGAINRRASLAAGAHIAGPPEPFVRSALSRKKLNSTPPRYMNYENAPGYAERARQQYERRKRLEEENAAKSEKRQRELRTFFSNKQQTSLMSRTDDEDRRGSEAYECATLANENEIADQKALRAGRQRTGPTRTYRRAPSATSSAGTSSSNGVLSRTSKKSSVSSVAEKVVSALALEATEMESEEVTECTFVTEDTVVDAGIDC